MPAQHLAELAQTIRRYSGAYKSMKIRDLHDLFCAVLRQWRLLWRINLARWEPSATLPQSGQPDPTLCLQLLQKLLHLISGERRQNLLQITKRASGLSI